MKQLILNTLNNFLIHYSISKNYYYLHIHKCFHIRVIRLRYLDYAYNMSVQGVYREIQNKFWVHKYEIGKIIQHRKNREMISMLNVLNDGNILFYKRKKFIKI